MKTKIPTHIIKAMFFIAVILFAAKMCHGQKPCIRLKAPQTFSKAFARYTVISDTAQLVVIVTDEPCPGVFRQAQTSAKAFRGGALVWETNKMRHGNYLDTKYFVEYYIKPKL